MRQKHTVPASGPPYKDEKDGVLYQDSNYRGSGETTRKPVGPNEKKDIREERKKFAAALGIGYLFTAIRSAGSALVSRIRLSDRCALYRTSKLVRKSHLPDNCRIVKEISSQDRGRALVMAGMSHLYVIAWRGATMRVRGAVAGLHHSKRVIITLYGRMALMARIPRPQSQFKETLASTLLESEPGEERRIYCRERPLRINNSGRVISLRDWLTHCCSFKSVWQLCENTLHHEQTSALLNRSSRLSINSSVIDSPIGLSNLLPKHKARVGCHVPPPPTFNFLFSLHQMTRRDTTGNAALGFLVSIPLSLVCVCIVFLVLLTSVQ
ncbi:hypothetical protein J6590_044215 [Homalodisca vitripennis]|nr:hypothetical protein J6590_044215 [Homalodisca vitripennis]